MSALLLCGGQPARPSAPLSLSSDPLSRHSLLLSRLIINCRAPAVPAPFAQSREAYRTSTTTALGAYSTIQPRWTASAVPTVHNIQEILTATLPRLCPAWSVALRNDSDGSPLDGALGNWEPIVSTIASSTPRTIEAMSHAFSTTITPLGTARDPPQGVAQLADCPDLGRLPVRSRPCPPHGCLSPTGNALGLYFPGRLQFYSQKHRRLCTCSAPIRPPPVPSSGGHGLLSPYPMLGPGPWPPTGP